MRRWRGGGGEMEGSKVYGHTVEKRKVFHS